MIDDHYVPKMNGGPGQSSNSSNLRVVGTVHITNIVAAQWEDANGRMSYSIVGLGADGRVYRYDGRCNGWMPYANHIVECRDQHKGNR